MTTRRRLARAFVDACAVTSPRASFARAARRRRRRRTRARRRGRARGPRRQGTRRRRRAAASREDDPTRVTPRRVTFESGRLARLTDGAVLATSGTRWRCAGGGESRARRASLVKGFVPLMVDYRERSYAKEDTVDVHASGGSTEGARDLAIESSMGDEAVVRRRLGRRPWCSAW